MCRKYSDGRVLRVNYNLPNFTAALGCRRNSGMVGFDSSAMNFFPLALVGLVWLAVWGGGLFAVVYFATRLAIRHERRVSNSAGHQSIS